MGQQSNKVQKKTRRKAYLKRKTETTKAKFTAKAKKA